MIPKPTAIVVVGRRWFDRKNGNTYHSVEVFSFPALSFKSETAYGYGDAYLETAGKWLSDCGLLTRERYASGGWEALQRACERQGIPFRSTVCDVQSRKDL